MTIWRKSTHSGGGGGATDCVELAQLPALIAVRDSKNPSGPILEFHHTELAVLLKDIKADKHKA